MAMTSGYRDPKHACVKPLTVTVSSKMPYNKTISRHHKSQN